MDILFWALSLEMIGLEEQIMLEYVNTNFLLNRWLCQGSVEALKLSQKMNA